MLGEITGVFQIGTCLCMCVATAIWLKVLSHTNKLISEMRREQLNNESKIYFLEQRVEKLTRIAWVNHELEMIQQSINKTKGEVNDKSN